MIDFTLSKEQSLIEVRRRSIEAGLYSMNMPVVELGGGGLDYVTRAFRTARPSRP